MPTITVTVEGVRRVSGKLVSAELGSKQLATVVDQAADFAVANMQREASGLGAIQRDIHAESVGFLAKRVGTTHPGASPMNYGRHSKRLPPVAVIAAWAAEHGMAGMEWVIAQAIARRGIRGRQFVRRTEQELRHTEIPKLVHSAGRSISAFWSRR